MTTPSEFNRRRSIRLPDFDYSQNGAYFITICACKKQSLFGEIIDGEMRLNEYGQIVVDEWLKTPQIRREILLDEYIVMPNHFHSIVIIQTHDNVRRGDWPVAPTRSGPRPGSIGSLMVGFKAAVTREINALRHTPGAPVWHRNYYEHIIRNETDLNSIREYIRYNTQKWTEDEENPACQPKSVFSTSPTR